MKSSPISEITIQADIPVPERSGGGRTGSVYPFEKMEPPRTITTEAGTERRVVASFALPLTPQNVNKLVKAAWMWKKKNPGWNYTCRRLKDEIRIWRIAAILGAALLASPAYAWDTPTPAQGGTASASQHQSAMGGSAKATTGAVTASGGAGGHGGNSTITSNVNGGSFRQAPDVLLPSIGGGGMDCPTVGFGAGGSGLGGGGGFGPSWISSDCNKRKVAAELAQVYGPAVARAYMEREIPGVREAVAAAAGNEHVEYPFDWCYTRDAGSKRQREVCEGKR